MSLRHDNEGPSGVYLTVAETACVLRTTRKALYTMIERNLLPGLRRIGRRVLVRRRELIHRVDRSASA